MTGEVSSEYGADHSWLPGISLTRKTPETTGDGQGMPRGYVLAKGSSLQEVDYGYEDGKLHQISSGGLAATYDYYPGTGILRETTHTVPGGTPRIETRHVDLAGRVTGIVTTVPDGGGRKTAASAGYLYDARGLRERLTREDGTSWHYGYNDRGEVTSGSKKLANGSLAAGQQFGYGYDGIGNRESATFGDAGGTHKRTATYTPNALNQYETITTPGSFDVLVRSADSVGIVADGNPATVTRQGNLHRADISATNADGAWVDLDITSPPGVAPHVTGNRWIAPANFSPGYDGNGILNSHDADGNLVNDGRWKYAWDGENRLTSMTVTQEAADAGAPKRKLEIAYDWMGRRVAKKVSSTSSGTISSATWTTLGDRRFAYDGWNLIAEFAVTPGDSPGTWDFNLSRSYLWGLDLSGSMQGAGGVGGLLSVTAGSYICYPAYDGNGNIIAWTASNGGVLQRIDYDPFGNVLARENVEGFAPQAFGFSTKYSDAESGLIYYGYRYYDPVNGRWQSRDPIEERGGVNLYNAVKNNLVCHFDYLGLIDPNTDSWHHLYSQSVFNKAFLKRHCLDLDIDDPKFGWVMLWKDHSHVDHRLGWTREWKKWVLENDTGPRSITMEMIRNKKQEMFAFYELDKVGYQATVRYKKGGAWKKLLSESITKKQSVAVVVGMLFVASSLSEVEAGDLSKISNLAIDVRAAKDFTEEYSYKMEIIELIVNATGLSEDIVGLWVDSNITIEKNE